jgi:hypothetical protein
MLIASLAHGVCLPTLVVAQDQADPIYRQWEEAISQRRNGQYDEAISTLQGIVQQYPDDEAILRRAYNQLVFTYRMDRSNQGEYEVAREALTRFPDLAVDTIEFPAAINDIYDSLRREMFGEVTVRAPEESTILLGDDYVGESPLIIPYVPAGEYDLRVTKEGYEEHRETVRVNPGGQNNFDISLNRHRSTGWWVTRIGGAVVASAAIAFALSSGSSESTPPEEPLPGPPEPP